MKIKNYFIVGVTAIVLVLSSCSKENANTSDQQGDNVNKGYLSLSLMGPATRTSGSATQGDVADGDSDIKNVTIALVATSGPDVGEIQYVYPNANYTPGATPNDANAFQVNIGEYYVYAIVNPSGAVMDYLVIGAPIQSVLSVASAAEVGGYADNTNGFLMFNENNDVDGTGGVLCTITANNTITNPAEASISVDRVVAALNVVSSTPAILYDIQSSDTTPAAIASTVEFNGMIPLNARGNYNTIQQWVELNMNTVLKVPGTNVFYNTVGDLLNFQEIDGVSIVISSNVSDADFADLVFVLENRPAIIEEDGILTALDNETTGVVFKFTAFDEGGNATTFYRYNNSYFYDLAEAIAAHNAADTTNPLDPSATDPEVLRQAGIRVFEDGAMYYTYYIKDGNYLYNNLNYYVVHRNAVYSMNINNLHTVGTDLPIGEVLDPDVPAPILNTYISVAIQVNEWVLDTHNIDL